MDLEQLKRAVTAVLHQDDTILFAYLFGSQVKGTAHAQSDVDVAVYCRSIATGAEGDLQAVEKQITLSLQLEQELRRPVDVVVLNRATVDMRQNVLRRGVLLFTRDPAALLAFKMRQLREYQDFIMMEPIFRHYRLQRIKEGRFGGRTDDSAQTIRYH